MKLLLFFSRKKNHALKFIRIEIAKTVQITIYVLPVIGCNIYSAIYILFPGQKKRKTTIKQEHKNLPLSNNHPTQFDLF